MKDYDVRRPRPRASAGKQTLVVRQSDENLPLDEMLERLARVEASLESSGDKEKTSMDRGPLTRLDAKTVVALCAIFLSIAGYVIEDARSTSRQQAEIESTKVRVTNLEKIAAANTESRIRSEVELDQLRQGQAEIKEMLRAHEDETLRILRRK